MAAGHRLFFKLDEADPKSKFPKAFPHIILVQRVAA
jgi:hypothetical protein